MARPTVTVLIDTYNHERFIEEALMSVLEQDFPASEREILVVDDGSTDSTPEIVRKFEPRVRLLRKSNGGQASAFNAGISEARGEIVAFLDGDDWWARNKLTSVAEAMAEDRSVGIIGHGVITVHRDGREQTEILREGFRFQANTVQGARLFRLRRSLLGTSRMTIRAGLLQRIGTIPEALTVQADEYLFTLAAVVAEGRILPAALTYYRLHEANAFQISVNDPAKIRNKQRALAALARELAVQLDGCCLDKETRQAITNVVQAEADQLRLGLDGGKRLETLRAEWTIYDVHNAHASTASRAFKRLTLLSALLLPARTYYRLRSRLARSTLYGAARARFGPSLLPPHVTSEPAPAATTSHPRLGDRS